jgi:hypothetical protein
MQPKAPPGGSGRGSGRGGGRAGFLGGRGGRGGQQQRGGRSGPGTGAGNKKDERGTAAARVDSAPAPLRAAGDEGGDTLGGRAVEQVNRLLERRNRGGGGGGTISNTAKQSNATTSPRCVSVVNVVAAPMAWRCEG